MRKLSVSNSVSLDGYFSGPNGDISWAHKDSADTEWNDYVAQNASGNGPLLFGRITYELMAGFWPTPMAAQMLPALAERMNALPKIVFSRTLDQASWSNTKLLKGDLADEVRRLKKEPGEDIAILGSGSIVSQLAQAGLIDEYQVMINPVALGAGRTMFEGVESRLSLKLTETRTFDNGTVLLCYQPKT